MTFDLGAGAFDCVDPEGRDGVVSGTDQPAMSIRLAGRGSAYLPLRYTPLQPSGPAGRVRHFVEVFVWYPAPRTAWSLDWHLFEVVGSELMRIARRDAR